MSGTLLDLLLAASVLAVAAGSLLARAALTAILGFLAYGLLLTLAWTRLAAPDVALTEAAIGSLTAILLLGAAARLRGPVPAVPMAAGPMHAGPMAAGPTTAGHMPAGHAAAGHAPAGPGIPAGMPPGAGEAARGPSVARRVAVAALCAAVSLALMAAILLLPVPAPGLAPQAAAGLPSLGLGNPVTAVLIGYRALDTLLEKMVLLLALVGVWSLAPDRCWGGVPGRPPAAPDETLALLGRVLPPLGILLGLHLVWVGADAPGGTFQGGAVLAAMGMLAVLSGQARLPATGTRRLRLWLAAGPVVFFAVGLAGYPLAGGFLAYPAPLAKPLILLIEFALTPSLALLLALLLAGPAGAPPAVRAP